MRLLQGLMALTVALGITTAAHADGWHYVWPQDIRSITVERDRSTLDLNTDNGCGGAGIEVLTSDPLHDRTLLLFNRASIEGKSMVISVTCVGDTAYISSAYASAVTLQQ